MFVATSPTNTNHPSSYIVAASPTTTAPPIGSTTNPPIDSTTTATATNNATPQTLSDIKLICTQRKKVSFTRWEKFDGWWIDF